MWRTEKQHWSLRRKVWVHESTYFFARHFFLPPPDGFLPPPIIFFVRRPSLSPTVLCTYIIFVRQPLLSRTFLCSHIIFCPSTVVKLDINLPILSTNLQNAAPPLAGSAGPVVTPLPNSLFNLISLNVVKLFSNIIMSFMTRWTLYSSCFI